MALAIGVTSSVAFAGQSAAQYVNLRGKIVHDGSGSGLYLIFAFRLNKYDTVAGLDSRRIPGAYEVPDVPMNTSYALLAFRDLDGNMLPGLGEPVGWYGSPFPELVHAGTQDIEGLDIELHERLKAEIRGTVAYNGGQIGRIWVVPHWTRTFNILQIAGTPWTVSGPGDEYRSFVFSPADYYLSAWVDVNANLKFDQGEPCGTTANPVTVTHVGQVTTNNRIAIHDTGVPVESHSWTQIKSLYNR
jgi:hypothetical protein